MATSEAIVALPSGGGTTYRIRRWRRRADQPVAGALAGGASDKGATSSAAAVIHFIGNLPGAFGFGASLALWGIRVEVAHSG